MNLKIQIDYPYMVQFDDGMTGTFKASKNNCKYLLQILREHFIEKQ